MANTELKDFEGIREEDAVSYGDEAVQVSTSKNDDLFFEEEVVITKINN